MQEEVKVPSLGESIVSGVITQWHVNNGSQVNKGDLLYELETDKITSEGLADFSGVIEILAADGDEVKIGQVIAKIETDVEASVPQEAPVETTEPEMDTAESPSAQDILDKADTLKQSPAVERLAAETGIDPDTLEGTGKGGRVTKGDMLSAAEGEQPRIIPEDLVSPNPPIIPQPPEPEPQPEPIPLKEEAPRQEIVPVKTQFETEERTSRSKMTPLRRKIAERLVSAQNNAAILSTFNEVDMSPVMRLRKEMQDDFVASHGIKLGFMSFFVKAVVSALKAVPQINAQIDGEEIVQNHFFDIGVAVGTPKGLIVPVIRNCDKLSFPEIEKQIIHYAERAKDGKIGIEDLQGGVFTISNGGVYGSLLSTPIINPPQSGILGMHNIQERPIAENGQVVIRPMMYLALSYDHRIVDGKEAVTFLINIKKSIENPSRLMFGL